MEITENMGPLALGEIGSCKGGLELRFAVLQLQVGLTWPWRPRSRWARPAASIVRCSSLHACGLSRIINKAGSSLPAHDSDLSWHPGT